MIILRRAAAANAVRGIGGASVVSCSCTLQAVTNPFLAAIGHVIFGAIAGALSVWWYPALFMKSFPGQVAALVWVPIASGLVMIALGAWRRRKGQDLIRLDKFAFGYLFAFAMATVRFIWGSQ